MKKTVLFTFFVLIVHSVLSQPVVHITPSGAGTRSGDSWTNALPGTDLPGRVATATAGTQFWVAAGTYKPTTTTDRTASFSIASGVSVYGGFAGTETALEQRVKGAYETVLSGDIGNEGYAQDNSVHVVQLYNIGQTVTLDGLTIRDGRRVSSDYGSLGAGINVQLTAGSLTLLISNCQFISNVVEGSLTGGGAIAILARNSGQVVSLTVNGCYFSGNQAAYGGAYSPITQGGYINSRFDNCTFADNAGLTGAGAISNTDVADNPLNSLFIKRCKFLNNNAVYYGGAISTGGGKCEIENSLFANNFVTHSTGVGGVVDGSGSNSVFKNCLFSNNKAAYGGVTTSVAENKASKLEFINCNFLSNSASISGGVFYNTNGSQPSPFERNLNETHLKNCLVWQNTAPDEPVYKPQIWISFESDQVKSVLSATYSLIQNGNSGPGNLNTDPLFVDPANGNFRLKPNSPAINAGDPNTTGLPATDIAGQARVQGERVAIGAYESAGCPTVSCLPFTIQRQR